MAQECMDRRGVRVRRPQHIGADAHDRAGGRDTPGENLAGERLDQLDAGGGVKPVAERSARFAFFAARFSLRLLPSFLPLPVLSDFSFMAPPYARRLPVAGNSMQFRSPNLSTMSQGRRVTFGRGARIVLLGAATASTASRG